MIRVIIGLTPPYRHGVGHVLGQGLVLALHVGRLLHDLRRRGTATRRGDAAQLRRGNTWGRLRHRRTPHAAPYAVLSAAPHATPPAPNAPTRWKDASTSPWGKHASSGPRRLPRKHQGRVATTTAAAATAGASG